MQINYLLIKDGKNYKAVEQGTEPVGNSECLVSTYSILLSIPFQIFTEYLFSLEAVAINWLSNDHESPQIILLWASLIYFNNSNWNKSYSFLLNIIIYLSLVTAPKY